MKPFIASMGIYVFKRELLVKLLRDSYKDSNDFGGEIIPSAAKVSLPLPDRLNAVDAHCKRHFILSPAFLYCHRRA